MNPSTQFYTLLSIICVVGIATGGIIIYLNTKKQKN